MSKVEPYNHDTPADPAVNFATDAEIEIADQLRHRLEERYFTPSVPPSSLQARPSQGR